MAKEKKVFSIVINGITESVDAVKSLNEQLRDAEAIIKNLSNAKIDVKVSTGKATTTEKVGTGTSSTDSKVQLDIEKEKTKQIEMQNEALREQYIQREQLKQQNKETLDDIKQEAKGYVEVVDGVKEYANTLNGMSAELKDIKNALRNTDIDTNAFKELTERAGELNEKLKKAEAAYGQLGRNVGNYTQSFLEALRQWDEEKDFNVDLNISGAENSLNDLKAQLIEAKRYWANLSPDNADFDKTAKAIKSLNQQIEDMESNLKDVGEEANSAFTGRFTTTIGGVEASFTNASEAAEALRKKLVSMRIAGEENTPMYQEIIQLVRRLSKEVMIANQQVAGMTKTTQNMGKVISVMKGLSSLAALGQGISGLFGGASEDLDKFIQKFASLTMVIAGLKELEELINSGQGAWGKLAQNADNAMNKMVSPISNLKEATAAVREYIKANEELSKSKEKIASLTKNFNEIIKEDTESRYERMSLLQQEIEKIAGMSSEWQNLEDALQSIDDVDEFGNVQNALDALIAKFPELEEKATKYVNAVNHIDTASERATQTFYEYQEAEENLNKAQEEQNAILEKLSPRMQTMAKSLGNMGVAGKLATNAIYGLATALKALAKVTIVLVALQLMAEALTLLTDGLKMLGNALGIGKAWDSLKQSVQNFFGVISGGQLKKLNNDLDTLEKKLDSLSKEYDIQVKIGNMGDAEAQLQRLNNQLQLLAQTKELFDKQDQFSEWQKELQTQLDKTDSGWQDLTKTQQDAAEGLQALTKVNKDFIDSLKNKTPQQQLEAIDKKLKEIGLDSNKMAAIETVLSQDDEEVEKFLSQLSDIDMDLNDIGVTGAKTFGRMATDIAKAREAAAAAIAMIKADLKSLENQNIQLKLQLDPTNANLAFQSAISSMAAMAQKYGIMMSPDGLHFTAKAGDSTGAQIAKQLEENAKLQKQITDKQIADRKKQEADRIKSERERAANEAKQAATEAKKRARNETAARLEAMEDGMEKEIALLEQKRKEEIEEAKETGKNIVDINTIYDRQILEVKKKYAKYVEDLQREHNERLMSIATQFLENWKNIQREIEDTRADTSMGNAENKNITVKQNISYDTNTQGSKEGIAAQKKYYEELKQSEIQYLNEKEQIEKEAAQRNYQRQLEDEDARFKASKEAQKKELEELERSLKEKVDAHQITEEEANKVLQETRDEYLKGEEKDLQTHNEKMQSITENGKAVLTNIELQYNEERKAATASALEEQRQVTQNFYNDIDTIMERTQKRKTNDFGFINYGAYRQSLQDALDATKEVANQIESEKEALQNALDNNEISFDDFQKAKKELDDFAEEVKDKTDDLKDGLSNSFNTWMGGVMESINSYSSVLSGMFDSISEMYTRQLDAEQAKLDKQQELLDAELEMIEENLQKQEEVTQEHNDKVNSIEDELKSARGDRRQALIDQLAAERKAQEQSIEKEKQLTEEKKKQAQKQEQLKKQQDALDKKRKQQEKRASIVQATINTFTAVSNALAVQPWFVGLALSGVALGLGMANVAQIASQQYGKGGKLTGPAHKDGGIPVGNTGITVEGNEYIIRKESTMPNLPLLEYINSSQRRLTKDDLIRFYDNGKTPLINRTMTTKFAEGGELPQLSVDVKSLMNNVQAQQDDRPLVVSVVDIVNQTENLRQVRVLAGDIDE